MVLASLEAADSAPCYSALLVLGLREGRDGMTRKQAPSPLATFRREWKGTNKTIRKGVNLTLSRVRLVFWLSFWTLLLVVVVGASLVDFLLNSGLLGQMTVLGGLVVIGPILGRAQMSLSKSRHERVLLITRGHPDWLTTPPAAETVASWLTAEGNRPVG
jgi:hypothetical protein